MFKFLLPKTLFRIHLDIKISFIYLFVLNKLINNSFRWSVVHESFVDKVDIVSPCLVFKDLALAMKDQVIIAITS